MPNSFVVLIVCVLTSFCILPSVLAGGKTAPLLPEEIAVTVVQSKWNGNGFGVNHTAGGTWYSSYALQKIRFDSVAYEHDIDSTTVLRSSVAISILDFTVNPPVNYFWEKYTQGLNDTCQIYTDVGFLPPFPSTFLRDINAVYSGQEFVPFFGLCDKWSFFIPDTLITFYFDAAETFVRWDLVSSNLQTSVVTLQFNQVTQKQPLSKDLFAPALQCNKTVRKY